MLLEPQNVTLAAQQPQCGPQCGPQQVSQTITPMWATKWATTSSTVVVIVIDREKLLIYNRLIDANNRTLV